MTDRTLVGALRAAVAIAPDRPAIRYFDGVVSFAQLDADSDALAAALRARGIAAGDRVMICLQNVPGFVIALLAAARIGAIVVPCNPMYRARELAALLADAEPGLLIAHDAFLRDVADMLDACPPRIAVSPRDRQTRDDPRAFGADQHYVHPGVDRLEELVRCHVGQSVASPAVSADDTALIIYTSGTTGEPKGAMLSHANLDAAGRFYSDAVTLGADTPVLGIAPLFHVTALSGHIAASLIAGAPLILGHRFHPGLVLDAIAEHRPAFTVGAITALAALIDDPAFDRDAFACFRTLFSGGAPIPPALQARVQERTGLFLQNVYGLTETAGPVLGAPVDVATPVDAVSGALSVGRAVAGATIRIVADDGVAAAPGAPGEIVVAGPTVTAGYWRKPEATRAAFSDQGFHTGDIGIVDGDGWVFIVDRKKDMIIASGFKVWPREVEDVLYRHPAVREAAVVGVPDAYRGETVKAFVSLREGADASEAELIAFCRDRLAAYKCPRRVEMLAELPKTVTGKILRRALRGAVSGASSAI